MDETVNIFSELLANPLGDLISSIGRGVGEAQAALDEGSLRQTLALYSETEAPKDETPDQTDERVDQTRMIKLLREIGYQPTFYVIPETEVEAQVSLSMTINNKQQSPLSRNMASKHSIMATPINAGNVNRFGISANAIAKLKFKIVPVPPASAVSEMRVVPYLIDKIFDIDNDTFGIIGLIEQLGFTYKIEGSLKKGTIIGQTPKPNEIVKFGDEIVLTLK